MKCLSFYKFVCQTCDAAPVTFTPELEWEDEHSLEEHSDYPTPLSTECLTCSPSTSCECELHTDYPNWLMCKYQALYWANLIQIAVKV